MRHPLLGLRFIVVSSVAVFALLTCLPHVAHAGPRWVLVHYRQIGNIENAGSLTIENHLFREDGSKGVNIGVTNASNYPNAIFGVTDGSGWNRLNPLDTNNCAYDITIANPPTPADNTPNFYWQNPPQGKFYSYITHWMYVADDSAITTFPNSPVYQYDLVDGINQAGGFDGNCNPSFFQEPNGTQSDAKVLLSGGWDTYQAQTFVVPPGVNRIVSAQIFVTRGIQNPKFFYRASIREGGPTGPMVGPWTTSREVFSGEFKQVTVNWGLNDVPVTPGQTYAIRAEATDGGGFNAYATTQDNYPDGIWYHGTNAEPGRDLFAIIVGVGYDQSPPTIQRSPSSLSPSATAGGGDPSNDQISISNSGGGILDYTITDNVNWLSVSPTSGSSTGGTNNHTVSYNTSGLSDGTHNGTITISDPDATNTPQTIAVTLTLGSPSFAKPDFDLDNDVDSTDFGKFQSCFSGAGIAQNEPTCANAKLDNDSDVDADDLTRFLQCLSGANVAVSDTLCHQ